MVTQTSTGITFDVADLTLATKPLEDFDYRKAVELSLGSKVEACPYGAVPRLMPVDYHGLFAAVHQSFADHRPLSLSPDHIWLAICQGVAMHINQNTDSLRKHFVDFSGKKELVVRRDDFIRGSIENPWPEVFPKFAEQIRTYTGQAADRFVPAFSTTSDVEKAACDITLMDAVQSYFTYKLVTLCGIPRITLEGSPSDWLQIRERAKLFGEYDLLWWTSRLDGFLTKLHETSLGNIDREWWESFYKWGRRSGGADIDGHSLDLCPYVKDDRDYYRRNPRCLSLEEKLPQSPKYDTTRKLLMRNPAFLDRVSHTSLPSGLSKAPIVWQYFSQKHDYQFVSGFVGVRQFDDLTVRPEIGWAVRERSSKPIERTLPDPPSVSQKKKSWFRRLFG